MWTKNHYRETEFLFEHHLKKKKTLNSKMLHTLKVSENSNVQILKYMKQ